VVEARSGIAGRSVDGTIVSMAHGGIYAVRTHRERLAVDPDPKRDPDRTLDATVRRLEALRRAGIVERMAEGVWRIPGDLVERAAGLDRQRGGELSLTIRSVWPIERQARAIGATWLDQQLIGDLTAKAETGFGAGVRIALGQRQQFLIEQGFAEERAGAFVPKSNLLATLRARELERAAKTIAAESGLVYRPSTYGQRVSGVYRRSVSLASGRFALLDDGVGFSLVPWQPVIERRLGQSITGIVRGGQVSWDFSRQRGLGIG
jgi:hypothetical protein